MKNNKCHANVPPRSLFRLAILPILVSAQAQAVEISLLNDEVTGSLDSVISYGRLWRVQGQDENNALEINENDGNRNFNTGLVSEVFKITSDLELNYRNYGVLVRGTAFYDTQIMDKRNDFNSNSFGPEPSQNYPKDTSFTYETRHKAGRDAQILDAYVFGNWDIGDMPVSARLGNQVFNWGESIYYRGGVNTTNPVDAAKFRLPGSEIKEVLVPLEALSFSVGLTDALSMDAFYQFNWKETAIDPVGTYFGETDLFADGGNTAYARLDGTPLSAPLPIPGGSLLGLYDTGLLCGVGGLCSGGKNFIYPGSSIVRAADIKSDINAKNDGQFGISFRYMAEELNSTEFGFYMVNYHAKEPTIYSDLGSYSGVDVLELAQTGCFGATANAACFGDPAVWGGFVPLAGGLATIDTLANVQARRQYAEDIRMYGLSFNTTINETSLFGEIAYRPNLPIGVSATNDLLGDLIGQAAKFSNNNPALAGGPFGLDGSAQLAGQSVQFGDSVSNQTRVEAFNLSLGAIHNFGPSLSFDSLYGVAELASEHLRADSLQYSAYDGSKRYYAGRGNSAYIDSFSRDDQVNRNAYGYTLMLTGTWNDVYAGVNLSPFAVFKHDFEGNSHQTGNFIEGRKAYSVGLRATYLNALEAELQYTEFYGAGQNNGQRDRDNIGLNLKYSF